MRVPLTPIVLYARLAEASAALSRALSFLREDDPLAPRLEAAWLHLDDLIEQLPAALAWEAQHQEQEDSTP
jgi:hypothetical protein